MLCVFFLFRLESIGKEQGKKISSRHSMHFLQLCVCDSFFSSTINFFVLHWYCWCVCFFFCCCRLKSQCSSSLIDTVKSVVRRSIAHGWVRSTSISRDREAKKWNDGLSTILFYVSFFTSYSYPCEHHVFSDRNFALYFR